ncbi:MAG: M20/M25/M40 family metallo-hydrolase [Armatimonadota bacterium]
MPINRERMLNQFLDLLRIDSPPLKEGRVAEYVLRELERMGFSCVVDDAAAKLGGETGNVIAYNAGRVQSQCLMLSAHMDTVQPTGGAEPLVEDGIVRSSGETILGADDKAAIAVILETLKALDEDGAARGPVEVVLSVAEEVGLRGARAMDLSLLRSKFGYVLDSGKPAGGLITSAPSHDLLTVRIRGKAAHAGAQPEAGVSAIQAAALAIAKMRLGRIDDETTANVGTIQGGQATNIIPDFVEVRAEARSRNADKLQAQVQHMLGCFHEGAAAVGASVDAVVERAYVTYHVPDSDSLVQWALEAGRHVGLAPTTKPGGGGSDANVFNANGIRTVVLGVGYEDVHSTSERIAVDDMVKTAEMLYELVLTVARHTR